MNYRKLGKTGLMVSEIGFGGEWLERHDFDEAVGIMRHAHDCGINIVDCWMPDAKSRDIIGEAMKGCRDEWYVQGHFGSTLKDGQYFRTRELDRVITAFEDMLERMHTDYIDLGMIHFVDSEEEWDSICHSDYLDYIMNLKAEGTVRHIGMSSHNPRVALKAAKSGFVEMILFSINPAFDMLPPNEDMNSLFADEYDSGLSGIDPERAELYRVCEQNDVGITVMKGFAGGRLFSAERSPFGVSLTAAQCIHYALTRPAVASILCGYDSTEQVDDAVSYENADEDAKDYGSVLSSCPAHSFTGKCMYCNHCKPCPMDIDIAMVNKYLDLALMQPEVPVSLKAHYNELEHNADDCISCGGCEERCPFKVNVIERMEMARKLFD